MPELLRRVEAGDEVAIARAGRAVVAVIRLAALFEDERRFGALLGEVTERERIGIRQTRNIAAHHGYASMDEETFWETATADMPAFIAKLRAVNEL